MRSVMETNEIETAPLHSDPAFPRKALQIPPLSKPQLDLDGNLVIKNLKVPETLFDHVFGFQKFAPDKNPKKGDKSLWRLLQEYDESRARLPTSRRSPLYPRHNRDPEEPVRRHVVDEAGFLATSSSEKRPTPLSSHALPAGSMASHRKSLEVPGPSLSLSSKLSSPTKAPRFMRHISLSNRGFGIAAPKAALAEVSIETANASRSGAAVRNISDPSMTPTKSASSSTLSPQPISTMSRTSSHAVRPPSSYSQDTQFAPETPSRPIVIRSAVTPREATPQTILASTLRAELGSDLDLRYSDAIRADDAKKVYNSKLLAGVLPELPSTLSPHICSVPVADLVEPVKP